MLENVAIALLSDLDAYAGLHFSTWLREHRLNLIRIYHHQRLRELHLTMLQHLHVVVSA
jgi:hypothetical protein